MALAVQREVSKHDPNVIFLELVEDGASLGGCSLCLRRRCWVLGYSTQPRASSYEKEWGLGGDGYSGRGWRQRIEADAEAALRRSHQARLASQLC